MDRVCVEMISGPSRDHEKHGYFFSSTWKSPVKAGMTRLLSKSAPPNLFFSKTYIDTNLMKMRAIKNSIGNKK